jgi:predicted RNA-binding Zn ribbon-like protein
MPDCTEGSPQSFDAVDCHLNLLASLITEQPSDTFGGRRVTLSLLSHTGKAHSLVDAARAGVGAEGQLRLALRQLRTIRRALVRKAKNGETPADLALALSTLVDQTIGEIGNLTPSQ